MKKKLKPPPLGTPGQPEGMPALPSDAGDDVQERFRYQSAIGVTLLCKALIDSSNKVSSIWCEHHDDYLVEYQNEMYSLVQVKSKQDEGDSWVVADSDLQGAIKRYCLVESDHGNKMAEYTFCSNAKPFIPSVAAEKAVTLEKSPVRLVEACRKVESAEKIPVPYLNAFEALKEKLAVPPAVLFRVLRKLEFTVGPPLRSYDDVLTASVVAELPGCASLSQIRLRLLKDAMITLVQSAGRTNNKGLDGVIAYLSSDGRPENAVRNKCITLAAFRQYVVERQTTEFQFVDCGLEVAIGSAKSKTGVLERKMRNSFLGGQFEGLKWRMLSADSHLMERGLQDPDNFEQIANQLTGVVLLECKDAEAKSSGIEDAKKRGLTIYKDVLDRMEHLASNQPSHVHSESKNTLIGIAGMLSGECRFGWGVDLEESKDGT